MADNQPIPLVERHKALVEGTLFPFVHAHAHIMHLYYGPGVVVVQFHPDESFSMRGLHLSLFAEEELAKYGLDGEQVKWAIGAMNSYDVRRWVPVLHVGLGFDEPVLSWTEVKVVEITPQEEEFAAEFEEMLRSKGASSRPLDDLDFDVLDGKIDPDVARALRMDPAQ